jgi:hypothetical protein
MNLKTDIYVFYCDGHAATPEGWLYNAKPAGWTVSLSADVPPSKGVGRFDLFTGPVETCDEMRNYLEGFFKGLEWVGVVEKYKLETTWRPLTER